jgi:hypothetical protein
MSVLSLAEAVAIRKDDTQSGIDGIPTDPIDALQPIWQLLTLECHSGDYEESRVRRLHLSVREYLSSDTIQKSRASSLYIDVAEAQNNLSETYLQYFQNLDLPSGEAHLEADPFASSRDPLSHTFLRYAASY